MSQSDDYALRVGRALVALHESGEAWMAHNAWCCDPRAVVVVLVRRGGALGRPVTRLDLAEALEQAARP